MVVPNGVLFADEGAPARIKKKLLTEFNLHTIVRLPNGVFAPYTTHPLQPALLRVRRAHEGRLVLRAPPPEGRKNYTKTKPLRFEEFADVQAWWGGRDRVGRVENEHAWKVDAETLAEERLRPGPPPKPASCGRPGGIVPRGAGQGTDRGRRADPRGSSGTPGRTGTTPDGSAAGAGGGPAPPRPPVDQIDLSAEYVAIGVRGFGRGIFRYDAVPGSDLGKLRFFDLRSGSLVLSNIKAWEGAVAVSGSSDEGTIASNRFLSYEPIDGQADVNFLRHYFLTEAGNQKLQRASPGSADRNRTLAASRFEEIFVPPSPSEQQRIAACLDRVASLTGGLDRTRLPWLASSRAPWPWRRSRLPLLDPSGTS